ncbi:unnamed protein product [Schistosoma curassoni]|uniref:Uncharacterized protein n=1 Tax=Schistosoma curassoni TaxID=6186 RepID=A0A3P8GQG2_9TREM|nr:unnamed protein product [Schistosoma curassoni]
MYFYYIKGVSHPIIDNQLVDGNFNNNVNSNSPLISTVSSGESERTVVDVSFVIIGYNLSTCFLFITTSYFYLWYVEEKK